jgi:predicted nucleotidyltransferase
MIESFNKYIDLKVLGYFLLHPNTSINVNELARTLKVSPTSVNNASRFYHNKGYLVKDEKGLAHYYRLDANNPVVVSLKKAYGLDFILSARPREVFLKADSNILSLALYGSYASGTFDEDSDVDFLVVTPSKKESVMGAIRELEDALGKEVNVSVFRLYEWRGLANKEDAFYINVVTDYVLLYGAGLR